MWERIQLESDIWMDGWIQLLKKRKYYLFIKCSVSTQYKPKLEKCMLQMFVTILAAGWVKL